MRDRDESRVVLIIVAFALIEWYAGMQRKQGQWMELVISLNANIEEGNKRQKY